MKEKKELWLEKRGGAPLPHYHLTTRTSYSGWPLPVLLTLVCVTTTGVLRVILFVAVLVVIALIYGRG